MKSWCLGTGCIAGLIAAWSATAQDAAQSAPAAGANSGLQEIVVTAQRREESVQRAAVALSVITGDTMRQAGISRPTDLTALVPSLQVSASAGPYNLFYLRGVGNFNANAFSDSAIAFNFDNVFLGRPSSSTGFFYDLERVEVVKGPQGTLYGRNATGGAINVISKQPELGRLGAEASAEFGNYGEMRFDGMLNLPLGEWGAVRFAGLRVKHDGYMNDGTDDQDDSGGRVTVLMEPMASLTVSTVLDYFKQGGKGAGATPILAPLGVAAPTAFSVDQRIGFFSPQGQAFYTSQPAVTLGRNFYPFPSGFEQYQNNHWWGISSTVAWTTAAGTLTVIPAYRDGYLDYLSYTPGFQVRQHEESSQKSVEARFATTDDYPLRAIVGAFYYNEIASDPYGSYASNWNAQYDNGLRLDTESKAAFGRLTYAVLPQLRLSAGVRETWEDKKFVGHRVSHTLICLDPAGCTDTPTLPFGVTPPAQTSTGLVSFDPPVLDALITIDQREQKSFQKATWRAGVDWDVTDRNLLYASVETGFKAGGFYFSTAGGQYAPETIEAFTIGSKNRFFDNRLQANLEVFDWKYKDQQLSHLINIGGVPTFATENVGRATFRGLELETVFALTAHTTASADIQYLDAKYDSFVFRQANSGGATSLTDFNGTGCPTTAFDASTANSFVVNCSGRRPANAPTWTLNLGGQQVIPVPFGELVLDGRAHYQTETLTGLEFLPVEYQKAYWRVDAALTFYTPDKKYYLGTFVNNAFDKTVITEQFPTPGTNFFGVQLGSPRIYGVRVGAKF